MENLLKIRQVYFAFLFSSFLYFALLILIIGKDTLDFKIGIFEEILLLIGSSIPAVIFFLKRRLKLLNKENMIKLSVIGHVPLLIGFFLALLNKNYLFLISMFPVFFLGYLIILPTKKNLRG